MLENIIESDHLTHIQCWQFKEVSNRMKRKKQALDILLCINWRNFFFQLLNHATILWHFIISRLATLQPEKGRNFAAFTWGCKHTNFNLSTCPLFKEVSTTDEPLHLGFVLSPSQSQVKHIKDVHECVKTIGNMSNGLIQWKIYLHDNLVRYRHFEEIEN